MSSANEADVLLRLLKLRGTGLAAAAASKTRTTALINPAP